jgi:hypothetical protein
MAIFARKQPALWREWSFKFPSENYHFHLPDLIPGISTKPAIFALLKSSFNFYPCSYLKYGSIL